MRARVNVERVGSTYIEFDDVEVPVSNLLGQENRGFPIIMSSESFLLPTDIGMVTDIRRL